MVDQTSLQREPRWSSRRRTFLIVMWLACVALSFAVLILPFTATQASLRLQVGDVAGQDILATQTLSYQSEVLTLQQREEAANAVAPVYGPADADVAREQLDRLRIALNFINTVRQDSFASLEQKISDLSALQSMNLRQESAQALLLLDESAWQNIQQETIVVLEQVMRNTIRQNRLEEARQSIPALVSLSIPQEQARLIAELAAAFVIPNSFYSDSLTQAAREAARSAVQPVVRTFLSDEIIVQRGQVINEEDLEALQEFGLVQPEARWQDYVAAGAITLAAFLLVILYLLYRPGLVENLRGLVLTAVLFVVFLFAARLTIVDRTVIPYIFPIASFGLLVASLFSTQAAIVFGFILSVLAAYNLPNAFDLTLYYFLGTLFGVLFLRRTQRVMAFFWSGAAVGVASAAVIIAYRLPLASTDLLGMLTLLGAAALNGLIAASLTIVLQLFLAHWLGLTTTIQLLELARPDHPLLQFILQVHGSTNQHSLLIANLSEQAAEAIGADALLTRVGSLYHDTGKARQPHYFIENQVHGSTNPHDSLSPKESAKMILRHVPDGLELAAKHRLPKRITDFIAEHHGTLITRYQYARALEAAGGNERKINKVDFQYPGPIPQSRETALVMLADGSEARTRAERPETREELRHLVKSVIDNRLAQGQLDDTGLTMRDLKLVLESYVSGLRGVYHPRLIYPELDEQTMGALDAQPALKNPNPKS